MVLIVKSDFLKNYDTNWQGGHVGGVLVANTIYFFSRKIYMKIGFSSQIRERPKHTANMTAVTSRANQQYVSPVDTFYGFLVLWRVPTLSFQRRRSPHLRPMHVRTYTYTYASHVFFFLSVLAKILVRRCGIGMGYPLRPTLVLLKGKLRSGHTL